MGDVLKFPGHAAPVRARIEIVDGAAREFIVGIAYEDGRYILCGAFETFREASEVALKRSASLGHIPIVDFTNADPPEGGEAA